MRRNTSDGRCAERELRGVDDAGREERVVIWVERKEGAVWAVGRAVNPQHRPSDEPRRDDYLFEGYELERRARGGEWRARGRRARAGGRRRAREGEAVHPQGGPAHAGTLLLRPPLRPARLLGRASLGHSRFASGIGSPCGIVGREAERSVDARLELLRQRMLEPVGLVVHVVDADSERLGEVELEQPVVPDHLERHLLAGVRERDAAVGRVLGEPERRELLHHRARRRRGDLLAAGERRSRDALALDAELVDLLQVVLDRVAEIRVGHKMTV